MIDADNPGVKHDNNSTTASTSNGINGDAHLDPHRASSTEREPTDPGLRIIHRSNTAAPDVKEESAAENGVSERPSKKRRLHSTPARSRAASPPWNFGESEGPTTFIVDGKRKSGRVNRLPPELQPDDGKRKTRAGATPKAPQANGTPSERVLSNRSRASVSSSTPATYKGRKSRLSAKLSTAQSPEDTPRKSGRTKGRSAPEIEQEDAQCEHTPARRTSRAKARREQPMVVERPTRRRRQSTAASQACVEELESSDANDTESAESSDSGFQALDFSQLPPAGPTKRLKLNLRVPKLPVTQPANIPPPKKYASLQEFLEHDDPLAEEEGVIRTADEARREADIRLRILREAQPGGLLSEERCSAYQPDPQDEPPTVYGRWDYITAHAIYFQKLLLREQRTHAQAAKRLAQEAVEKWKEMFASKHEASRVLTEEEKLQLETDRNIIRYRQLMTDLKQAFELVKAEVNMRRLQRWEEEQHKQGQKALDEMLDKSQLLLDQRRRRKSSELASTNLSEDESDEEDYDSDDDDENMTSSSEDEEDEPGLDEDANLGPDELRAKYAAALAAEEEGSDSEEVESQDEGDHDEEDLVDSEHLEADGATPARDDGDMSGTDIDDEEGMKPDKDYEGENTPLQKPGQEEDEAIGGDQLRSISSEVADQQATPLDHETPDTGRPAVDAEGNEIDYSKVQLEEVDDALLDSDDASDSGSATEESGSESDSEQWASGDEESEEEESGGLLGFFSSKQVKKLKEEASEPPEHPSVEPPQEKASERVDESNSGGEEEDKDEEDDDEDDEAPDSGIAGFFSKKQIHEMAESSEKMAEGQPHTNGVSESADDSVVLGKDVSAETVPSKSPAAENREATPCEDGYVIMEDVDSKLGKQDQDVEEVPRSPQSEASDHRRIKAPSQLLRGKLREYQHDGLEWLVGLYEQHTSGILADEMGLGKTIQTIALLAYLAVHEYSWGPHLVVVPTSVILNWEMEFKKFLPGFKILTYYGSQEERKRKRMGWLDDDRYNVVITSYQLIIHDQTAFKRRTWHYLVLDEAHNIKNFKSLRWQTLLTFKTARRLLLTGTPLQNNIDELWSLLAFLMPTQEDGTGGFADLAAFSNALSKPTNQILEQGKQELDAEGQARVKQLHEVLRPYILRRLKADVEKQMPAKYEHVVYCRLSKRQRQLYDGFMGRADTKQALSSGNYMSVMNCLMSLRKVCNHPDLFETRQIVTSFAMQRSVAADFEIKDFLVRKRLVKEEDNKLDLDFLGLLPVARESTSKLNAVSTQRIIAVKPLDDLIAVQTRRLGELQAVEKPAYPIAHHFAMRGISNYISHLQTCRSVTHHRTAHLPVYGKGIRERLDLKLNDRFILRAPRSQFESKNWYFSTSSALLSMVHTVPERAAIMKPYITRFSCVTPAAVAADLAPLALSERGAELVRASPWARKDPFHESRIRLSIAFPDKRLLQYDCGKLQRLDKLLRDLQAGGHRALIFTQMTKVLDILEQFLNIHGHRYLRLDGATKVEQRQMLCEQFNSDERILCFILSSRSGGLGLNLTGADTVIFYDLDWNPAMDKQCQDRAHRIGQTRDVHIYRFVSEYTVEANILRKSNQKRLLDDVIIQKGDFTTDAFNRISYRDALLEDDTLALDQDAEASAALDKVLGDAAGLSKVLEKVEDAEDVVAAKTAQKEITHDVHNDAADFDENASASTPKTPGTPAVVGEADDAAAGPAANPETEDRPHVDEYMIAHVEWEMRDIPIKPPDDRRRNKKGKDRGKRKRLRV